MPITQQDYNGDAILGEQLSKLMEKEIRDRLKGDVPETLAHALCVMAAEIDSLKAALAAHNLGERVADSLDAQSLKVGGEDVAEALDSKIGNVKAAAGPNIGSVGTPSVTVTNNPTTHESTLTFNYLKGAKGDKGDTGTWGGTVDQTYNASSTNPQSGTAVAGAIANKQDKLGTSGSGSSLKYTINITGTAGTADKATTVTVNSMSSTDRYVAFVDENGNIYKGSATYNLANNTLVCNLSGNATSATNASGYTSGGGIDLAIQQLQTAIGGKEDKLVSGGTYNINVSKVGGYAIVVGPYSGVANTIYLY